MSGGHFSTSPASLGWVADDIDEMVDENMKLDDGGFDFEEKTILRFRVAAETLRLASKMLKRIDYLVSYDDGEETFHKRWDEEIGNVTTTVNKGKTTEHEGLYHISSDENVGIGSPSTSLPDDSIYIDNILAKGSTSGPGSICPSTRLHVSSRPQSSMQQDLAVVMEKYGVDHQAGTSGQNLAAFLAGVLQAYIDAKMQEEQ